MESTFLARIWKYVDCALSAPDNGSECAMWNFWYEVDLSATERDFINYF